MTVDEIYLNIGQGISAAIEDENWNNAVLNLELVGTGVVGYNGSYSVNNEQHSLPVRQIPREIKNWVRELHKITTEGDHNKWNKATYTLSSDGQFDIEFIWDQELNDEIERLNK